MRFRDDIAQQQFNMTQKTAHTLSVCIRCKEPQTKFATPEDMREYYLSALCPKCWEAVCRPSE